MLLLSQGTRGLQADERLRTRFKLPFAWSATPIGGDRLMSTDVDKQRVALRAEVVRIVVQRLHALLEDPKPELWSWNKAVGDAKRELRDQLIQELMPPPVDYAAIFRSATPTLRLVSPNDEGTD